MNIGFQQSFPFYSSEIVGAPFQFHRYLFANGANTISIEPTLLQSNLQNSESWCVANLLLYSAFSRFKNCPNSDNSFLE